MKNFIYKPDFFDNFDTVAGKAQLISTEKHKPVEFEFNGIACVVNKDTNLAWLYRDYSNSWLMEWKIVGPNCVENYDPQTAFEYGRRKMLQTIKEEKRQKEQQEKDNQERTAFEEKTKGIEIELSDAKGWKEFVDSNKDPYGACCVEYAEDWAKLMQAEFAKGKKIADCAKETSYQLGFLGITGFMYGCAVSMLAKCWKHGEALRLWHNLDTQIGKEGEKANESGGVLNPALLNIGV